MRPPTTILPRGLAVAALVYLALRAAVLAGRFGEICNPAYELTMVGNLAHAISSGCSVLPLSGYFDNCGGHIVSGLLAAPLYALIDDSYLVLKLVPVLQGLVTLGLAWAIVAPRAGRGAATLACFAFALGPPVLTRLSVMAMGNHFESLLPTFACFLAWLRWRERGGRREALVFGLLAGLSVFLYLGSLLWLAVLGAAHLRAGGPRAAARDALRAAPGLAVGALPLIWIAIAASGRLGGFLAHNLGAQARPSLGEGLRRAFALTTQVLPSAALYPDLGPLPGRVAEACLGLALVLAWLVVARASLARDGARTLPLVLYPLALVVALAFSRFDIEPLTHIQYATTRRYLAPYFGLFALTLGFAYGELARGSRPRLAAGLAGLLLATAPFALSLALPPQVRGPSGADFRGWSGVSLAHLLLRDVRYEPAQERPTWDYDRLAQRVAGLPVEEQPEVAFGFGYVLSLLDPHDPFPCVAPLEAALSEELHEDLAQGVGAFLRDAHHNGYLDGRELHDYLERQHRERPAAARAAARGLARQYRPPVVSHAPAVLELARALESEVPEELRGAWAQGLVEHAVYAPLRPRSRSDNPTNGVR